MDAKEKAEELVGISGTINIYTKIFKLDTSKIKTLSDVIDIIEAMDMTISWQYESCPEKFKKIYEKGILIETKP